MNPVDDKQKIQMLSYALGLAIGTLETIHAFNTDELENVIKRLKLMAEAPIFFVKVDPE